MMTLRDAFRENEMIGAMNIGYAENARSNSFHILWSSLLPVVPQFVNALEDTSVPQNDHIDDQPKYA